MLPVSQAKTNRSGFGRPLNIVLLSLYYKQIVV